MPTDNNELSCINDTINNGINNNSMIVNNVDSWIYSINYIKVYYFVYSKINLFSCLCKLYDHVMLHLFRKEDHSTTLCNLLFF